MQQSDHEENPLILELVEYIASQKECVFSFSDEDLLKHLDFTKKSSNTFMRVKKTFPKSNKRFLTYIREATTKAAGNIGSLRKLHDVGLAKSRKGKKRRLVTQANKDLLGFQLL